MIDRFEEEETRLAQLSGDQLRMLRGAARRATVRAPAPPLARRDAAAPDAASARAAPTDEPTIARAPLSTDEDADDRAGGNAAAIAGDEATRLVAPRDRRTPTPQRDRGAPRTPRCRSAPRRRATVSDAPPMRERAARAARRSPPPPPQRRATAAQPPTPRRRVRAPPTPRPPMPMRATAAAGRSRRRGRCRRTDAAAYRRTGAAEQRGDADARPTRYSQPYDRHRRRPRPAPPVSRVRHASATRSLKPWMLVVGALLMAGLAFAITRALHQRPHVAKLPHLRK